MTKIFLYAKYRNGQGSICSEVYYDLLGVFQGVTEAKENAKEYYDKWVENHPENDGWFATKLGYLIE